jgi:hypothetical protein
MRLKKARGKKYRNFKKSDGKQLATLVATKKVTISRVNLILEFLTVQELHKMDERNHRMTNF